MWTFVNIRQLLGMALCIILSSTSVSAATFDFSKEDFLQRLAQRLKNDATTPDTVDIVTDCRPKNKSILVCSFTDHGFQHAIEGMKKLNLANGNFHQQIRLSIKSQNGKISEIGISGIWSDPVNLFEMGGFLGDIAQTLAPSLTPDDTAELEVNDWKIGRGDSDPTIGQTIIDIKDWAEIDCTNLPSSQGGFIACIFLPRF